MRVNADFTQRVAITPDEYSWIRSPAAGVSRMMLDRIGDEVARATTLVHFAPGSSFEAHSHDGGEEFLVLDGVFSDDSGDFPAGSYVRNPIGTSHKPHTAPGCTILVKLHQFAADDRAQFCVDTRSAAFRDGGQAGLSVLPLHDVPGETVTLERLAPGTRLADEEFPGGAEFFVLEGAFADASGSYPAGSWLRLPPGAAQRRASQEGCLLWRKTGHLAGLARA